MRKKISIVFILLVLIIAFLRITIFFPVVVYSSSMRPQLIQNDHLMIRKIFNPSSIHRGDIIIVTRHNFSNIQNFIVKKVAAIPGDYVEMIGGRLKINGNYVLETNIYPDYTTFPSQQLSENDFFLLGDFRDFSFDSREYGPVDGSMIVGKAVFRYYPFYRFGLIR